MTIVCFGTTFREAPVALRERLVMSTADVVVGLKEVEGESVFDELVPLSTCNRTELYAVVGDSPGGLDGAFECFATWFVQTRGIGRADIERRFYRREGLDAVRHLSRVAAGLDSLVLGESEIARQVSRARDAAVHAGTAGEILPRVFQTAIRAGRRARAETAINRKPASVSSVALGLANEVTGGLGKKRVALIGTGKMGRLTCKALGAQGIEGMVVVSRTYANAERLAGAVGGIARRFAELGSVIADADVVITSTGAPGVIIDKAMARSAMESRASRELTLIDIAVPRDVDAGVGDIDGVRLFDIDALQDRIADHVTARQSEIPLVEAIIDEEVSGFAEWQNQLGVQPLISDLRSLAENIRQREIKKTLRHLGDVDQETRDHIEHLSRSLVNKLLHEPTQRLRANSREYQSPQIADLARQLFGLDRDRNRNQPAPAEMQRASLP